MRNKHHRTSHKLGKRAFALCLALAVICSCLVPVFATGGIATMDGGFVMDEGFGVGGDDAGFAVDTQEVPASADDAATMEMPASSGDAATMDTPVVDTGDAASTSGPTITTKETEYGTVTEYDWGDSQTTWTGEDAIATPNDHMKEDDAAFGVLPIEYHFWLKQLDSFDFQMLAHEAEMAEMSETEYLALFGFSEQYPIWHMDTIASTDTISNYKFANPTAKDDPAGENHEFAYWYTVDENGVETEFDPYKTYGSETDTTVNVYAKWKDASGDVAQDTTKTEDTAKTESKTVEVSNKAKISDTEDEVTITVKGLPENVKSLNVTAMGEGSMDSFYELYTAQNGTMAPLFGFKIAPKDADGNTVQPKGPVTVTISGLSDDIMISELAPFKVLHQVSATDIETINASYNNGTLTFATDSFSPFVIASKNGYETTTLQNRTYTIPAGGSQNVSISGISNWNFNSSCSQSGIQATATNSGYTITVASNVPVGTYSLNVSYWVNRYGWSSYSDRVTVQVTNSQSAQKDTTVKSVVKHAVVTYAYYEGGQWHWGNTYTDGQDFDIQYNKTGESISHYVFFVKPEQDYLLTTFSISNSNGGTAYDLYSVDKYNDSRISNYPGLEGLVAEAKKNGYIGMNGYMTTAGQTGLVLIQYFTGTKPSLDVSATATPNSNVKPGDTVRFNVSVKPETVAGSMEVKGVENTTLTINGQTYSNVNWTEQSDGTYTATVDYTATSDDWYTGKIELEVDASITYEYVLPVQDRDGKKSDLKTTATIKNSGTTEVTLASPAGVAYKLNFDPEAKADITLFPEAPTDSTEYFDGSKVQVKDYNRTSVNDAANGGVWTFTGWTIDGGDGTNYNAGDEVTMGSQKILFVGTWTFTKTFSDLTVTKHVSGLLGDLEKQFEFTLYVKDDVTTDHVTYTKEFGSGALTDLKSAGTTNWRDGYYSYRFTLKNGQSIKFTGLPVGTYYVQEDSYDNYIVSAKINGADATVTDRTVTAELTKDAMIVAFTNRCDLDPDTGVLLDTLPYIVILAVVVGGGILLMLRKRRKNDD